MKKRIAALVLSALCLCGCAAPAEKSETVQVAPPFWSAYDEDSGGTLYLLGSMHFGPAETEYPDYVMDAFSDCDTVAFELDISRTDDAVQAAEVLLCKAGESAKDILGGDYDGTVSYMKRHGWYLPALEGYIPYYWVSHISNILTEECGLYSQYGSEHYFLGLAKENGKEIAEIESFEMQYGMMADIPAAVQKLALLECIGDDNYAKQKQSMKELYAAWSSFDEEYLSQMKLFEEIPEGMEQDCETAQWMMYDSRQERMAEFAATSLESGEDVFMLVGAAHFYVGRDIITLLKEQGYTVCPIRTEDIAA